MLLWCAFVPLKRMLTPLNRDRATERRSNSICLSNRLDSNIYFYRHIYRCLFYYYSRKYKKSIWTKEVARACSFDRIHISIAVRTSTYSCILHVIDIV